MRYEEPMIIDISFDLYLWILRCTSEISMNYSQSHQNGRPWWPDTKMAVFFKSQNLFFIIYIKLIRIFGQVLMYKAAKMAGKSSQCQCF